jgi:hypothetical protein
MSDIRHVGFDMSDNRSDGDRCNNMSLSVLYINRRGYSGRDRMVDLQLHLQLVPITTKVVS